MFASFAEPTFEMQLRPFKPVRDDIYAVVYSSRASVLGTQYFRSLMKLAIHLRATIGIPVARRRVSRLTLFTRLKTPFRSNAISVTTLCLYYAL